MAHARHLLERLGQLQKAREAVMSISQTMISEIRSYGSPPEAVKSVMISTYLLLGEKEENLLDWRNIRAMIGKMGKAALKRRVVECEAADIKPLVAARVAQVVSETNINEVEDISKAISYFYGWCDTMLEEVKDYHSIEDFESLLTPQAPVVEKKKLKKNKVSPLPTPEVGKIKPVLAGDDLEDRLSPEGVSTAIEHEEDNESNPESSSDNDSDEEHSPEDVGMMGSRSSFHESNESVSKPSTSLSAVSSVASETSSPAQLETGDGPKIFI
uniref:Uncharacterized protein n=1 Tax=Ciona savignyi TaxID=51511 RepID=H2YJV6_CIOSA